MAKILNYYHLCPINDEKEFLGLSQDAEPGTVINTLGRNIIISVKVCWLRLSARAARMITFVSSPHWISVEQPETDKQLDGPGQAVEQSDL